jgi:TolB-like protein
MADATPVFGPFSLDRSGKVLLRDGTPVDVGQRGIALLKALIEARGSTVTKAELLELAWPDVVVEEGNLTVQIASLRKVLGPRPEGGDWIATVPRVGYRLIMAAAQAPDIPANVWPSIAVLPFDNLSGDPEQEYFADGMVEDIITALSRFNSFAVVARISSFVYKGRAVDARKVGDELGVRYVLEGSVRKAGSRLRITAQLIEAQSGLHLWAQNYDGGVDDVFDFQDRITENVVGVIEPRIQLAEIQRSHRERPNSLEAYDLYLRAFPLYRSQREEGNAEAVRLLSRAIELEPDNAEFLAFAAHVLKQRAIFTWQPLGPDDPARIVDWVERALANAAGNAWALAVCGAALIHHMKDYERGMVAIREAVRGNPNNMSVLTIAGSLCLHCGTIEESLAFSEQALRLCRGDVANPWAPATIAHAHMVLGNYEEALSWAQRSLTANANFRPTHWILIAANAQLGRIDSAARLLKAFLVLEPGATVARIWAGQPQQDPERTRAILDGLRLAGLPES